MKISKNKSSKIIIALIMVISIVVSSVALPTSNTVKALEWYPYVTASPNPVGIGQKVLIVFGMTTPTKGYGSLTYNNWMINLTKPDGSTQTIGPYNADPTGSGYATFNPDKVGTWKIQAHYPGGYVDFTTISNMSVPPADTTVFSLTVQQEPVPLAQQNPVPTEYWKFPIYGENQEWAGLIGGNWLMMAYDSNARMINDGGMNGPFNPYTTAPNTAHVLWTKPQLFGGVVGGATDMSYYTGSSYRDQLQPPVVISGRLYYRVMEEPRMGWYCVDLSTGETIWYINGTYPDGKGGLIQGESAQITLGQVLTYDTRNWHGGIPYLWSTNAKTWAIWDAWSGALMYTIVNAPVVYSTGGMAMTFVADQATGTLFTYQLDLTTNTLVKWNSTKLIDKVGTASDLSGLYNAPPKYNLDWKTGIEWNVTLPALGYTEKIAAWDPKDLSVLIISNQTYTSDMSAIGAFEDMAVSGADGHVLWRQVRNEGTWQPSGSGCKTMSMAEGIYTIFRKETKQLYAYSISTGNKLWVSSPRPNAWGDFQTGTCIAYGKVYSIAYDGEVWALDPKTGNIEWKWGPVNSGLETPYGVDPLYGGLTIADNKVILTNGEHSANSPLYRGEAMTAIDANNGTTIWRINGWYQFPVIADSVILGPNQQDGSIYCFGKGPSATSISVSPKISVYGDSVMIEGSVIDISPGTKDDVLSSRFPSGVPAVSDDSMTQWMEYLYQQKTMPTNATGVTVTLSVLDSNNNFRIIGTTATDLSGAYSYQLKPDIPGKYTVYASFAGSESYWPSSTETSFGVNIATTTGPTSTTQAVSSDATQMYVIIVGVAIIIAIAIGFAVTILTLRKRT